MLRELLAWALHLDLLLHRRSGGGSGGAKTALPLERKLEQNSASTSLSHAKIVKLPDDILFHGVRMARSDDACISPPSYAVSNGFGLLVSWVCR
ncbi:hypothetical protein IWX92DRAFT_374188 [Phyllosticta citricarpa]